MAPQLKRRSRRYCCGLSRTRCLLYMLSGAIGLDLVINLSVYLELIFMLSTEDPRAMFMNFGRRRAQIATDGEVITRLGIPISATNNYLVSKENQKEEPIYSKLFSGANETGMLDVAQDPLRASDFSITRGKPLAIQPAIPYLGVLLDAGRHYFPVIWIKRLLDRLSDLGYNLLHFRLTDDQTFNMLLESHPQLAYPTAVNNPERLVYTVDELKEITAYAKERGIAIMPEINVPGHAGSWAAGAPDLIVPCPYFTCQKGYGVPLNVTHPDLPGLLQDVLTEILQIFDDPVFLHLGGDEVSMSNPCFEELGVPSFDYGAFEKLLKQIIRAIGYSEEKVVRWEMTGQQELWGDLNRAGGIEQFWESHPGDEREATGPFFVSTWLYFDTNGDQNAYNVYSNTIKNFYLEGGQLPTAIIAGTFELSTEFWYDRNVLGKLLAVAMGASNVKQYSTAPEVREREVLADWRAHCEQLGFGPALCETNGTGVIPHEDYHDKWRVKWQIWKHDICRRLADDSEGLAFTSAESRWIPFTKYSADESSKKKQHTTKAIRSVLQEWQSMLTEHAVPHVGVILDVTSSMASPKRLTKIVTNYIAKLGFNLIQLPLVTNHGFVYKGYAQPDLTQSLLASQANPHYNLKKDLEPLIATAAELGIKMMPEISVSTDAAGWCKAGFAAKCPEHFCHGKGLPNDINQENLFPVLNSVIGELYQSFTSPYIHLGSDERQDARACFAEAGGPEGDFAEFETRLTTIMRDMTGIDSAHILRWENRERTHYPERTGNITHYRAGMTDIPQQRDDLFFATVDILEGDAWSVYQKTRNLVQLGPTGIMAEIRTLSEQRWKTMDVPQRLIAFALGASLQESANNDELLFQNTYRRLCEALGWYMGGEAGCSPPIAFKGGVTYVTDTDDFITQHCNLLTGKSTFYKAKRPVKPFYATDVTVKQQ